VSAEGTWLASGGHGFKMAYFAVFENATADYDSSRGAEALRLFQKGETPTTVRCDGPDGYVGELAHIINAIETGKPPSVVTARDGLSAVEIIEAEEQAIKTGQVVDL
jgi:predicted dehydrogenase